MIANLILLAFLAAILTSIVLAAKELTKEGQPQNL